jgi:hypothetical protein
LRGGEAAEAIQRVSMRLERKPGRPVCLTNSPRLRTSFFEKKEAKKLLLPAGLGTSVATAPKDQKFFGSFFQKRTASSSYEGTPQ